MRNPTLLERVNSLFRSTPVLILRAHSRYTDFVSRHPIILLLLLPSYLFLALVCSGSLGIGIAMAIQMLRAGNTDLNFEFASLSIILTLIPVAGIFAAHYLYLLWFSFVSLGTLDGSPRSVFTVVQLVGTTAILFALIHYYVALFSGPEAYIGMIDLADKNAWIWHEYNRLPRLLTPPPIGMVLDCLYFSFVTMATVGYGDIHPGSMAAKIATILEILVAFVLIVVILARVMSRPERDFKPTGRLAPRIRPRIISTSSKRVHRQRRHLSL